MQFFEKAVENYAKKRKQFYRQALHKDILYFSGMMEEMTATGRCKGIACNDCPVRLVADMGIEIPPCGIMTDEERKTLIAREFVEAEE